MEIKMKSRCHYLILIPCLCLLSACAGFGKPAEQQVQERAQDRWDRLVAGDIEGAYAYLSPGYRSGTSLTSYQKKLLTQKVQWTGATASEGDCSEDVCNVRISINFAVYGAVPGMSQFNSKSSATESWVKTGGQWYYIPRD